MFKYSYCSRPAVFIVLLLTIAVTHSTLAEWPSRVFVPYLYLGAGDQLKVTDCDAACGQKFFTLAFVTADREKNPAWDGQSSKAKDFYADQITAIRKAGGDALVSFGGAGGRELALAETDVVALEAKYQTVIDRYQLTWLDFDIEGKSMKNIEANERRNTALAHLQSKHRGLRISYTLPVDPGGIPKSGLAILADAKSKGVAVFSANVMTMDFDPAASKGKRMSDVSIASALKSREQCQSIDEKILIGLTPMIGQNDEKSEVFTQDDARRLVDWATAQPWVCSVSFWAINRDTDIRVTKSSNIGSGIDQKRWEFTRIFQGFAAR